MASEEEDDGDFYSVLGLKKDCTQTDLRSAYKKLALRWHPDRCSTFSTTKQVRESKENFQAIQEAYSVLSDTNKRFMYDVGVYDSDQYDDDMNDFLEEMGSMMNQPSSTGMHDFLNEMGAMMNNPSSSANGLDSFESLQGLFEEMFPGNIEGFSSVPSAKASNVRMHNNTSSSSFTDKGDYKRNTAEMNFGKVPTEDLSDFNPGDATSLNDHVFCFVAGATNTESSRRGSKQKNARKQKTSVRRS